MNAVEKTESQLKHEQIAIRAFHVWERAGCHHHHDLEHWLQAESELGAALPNTGWHWQNPERERPPSDQIIVPRMPNRKDLDS